MSFTTIETVKKHIPDNRIAVDRICLEPVILTVASPAKLKYPPVASDSEKLKAGRQNKPDFEKTVFPASGEVNLSVTDIMRGSVVVASDSSLGILYRENTDYLVDYDNGRLRRISSGNIPPETELSVWYIPYKIYVRGLDYKIDYAAGEITVYASGSLGDGQLVYVDYTTEYAVTDDQVIANAIAEANEQILNYIDPAFVSSSDRSLVIAETYLSVSIVCLVKAMQIASLNKSGADKSWLSLAGQYKRDAYLLLEKFTGSRGELKFPSLA